MEYYNAIYTKGNPAPSILFWELSTAVSEYPGFRVPDFFARMRACDKVSGTHLARRFIDLVTLMLLLFAAVDDVVSEGGRQASSTPVPTPSPPSATGTASRGRRRPWT